MPNDPAFNFWKTPDPDEIFISESQTTGKEWGGIGGAFIALGLMFYHVVDSGFLKSSLDYLLCSFCLTPLSPFVIIAGQWIGRMLGEFYGAILGWLGLLLKQVLRRRLPEIIPALLTILGAILTLTYDGMTRLISLLISLIITPASPSVDPLYSDAFGPILTLGCILTGAVIGYWIGLEARPDPCKLAADRWWDGSEK